MRKCFLFALAGTLLFLAAGCKSPEAVPTQTAAATPDSEPLYRPSATIKDIMDSEVDPSADYMWDAVATIISEKGIEERQPRTPKEWQEIRRKAVTLVEATNLLVMPGRMVARPGEKSENPGIELSPEEINAVLEKDRPTFIKHAHTLNDAGLKMLAAIDKKDIMGISDAGAELDEACESCHLIYWYPNQGKDKVGGAPSL